MSEAPEAATANPQTITITLATPIRRKGGDVAQITLRKPKAGALRGLKVEDLYGTDVNALIVLLPRISEPPLIAAEIEDLESEDFIELAGAVKGFFMSVEMKAAINRALGAQSEK